MAARVPVKLNGVVLPPAMIAAEAQHHPARTPAAAFEAAARALIVRTLLLEEAQRLGIAAQSQWIEAGKRELDDEARIRALMEAEIPMTEPDEAACRAFYEANPSRFRSAELFEASHILFAAHPHDGEAYGAARKQAEAVIAELETSPDRFDAMAREHSQCDSRTKGGRLGQIGPGETVPEFEAALRALEAGNITREPVMSRFGAHVVRLDALARGDVLPFGYVHAAIADYLAERQWRRDVAAYVGRLVQGAQIEGVDMSPAAHRKDDAA